MTSLQGLQQAFQDYLLGVSDKIADSIEPGGRLAVADQLAVYRFAYGQRLAEALANDFPGLLALLGRDDFALLARDYVARHPSRHPSLRYLGAALPDYLTDAAAPQRVGDMARFDWAVAQAFDAADEAPIAMSDILALPPAAWDCFRLKFAASVSIIAGDRTIGDLRQALLRGASGDPAWTSHPATWLIWRQDDEVQYRLIMAEEKAALDHMRGGGSFGGMCALLAGVNQAPQNAAEYLNDWVARGLVVGFDPGNAATP